MSTNTPNYQLLKADPAEFVSVVTQINDNYDKIDQDMNRFDRQIFSTPGAGQTWTKPARAKRVIVRVAGGGGGSGGVAATGPTTAACSGGGGGGGVSEKLFLASSLSATETIDVGAGGTAGAAGNNNGAAGGVSNFATGKAYVVATTGGLPGLGGAATATVNQALGGVGGTGSGGDINSKGGVGGAGLVLIGPSGGAIGSYINNYGGASKLSGQVIITGASQAGVAGDVPGGGAGGAENDVNQAARAGAAGGNGVVIVDTYY